MGYLDEEPQEEKRGPGGWIVTFADMMSLLLTFFIILQAYSTISERKFYDALASIQMAFRIPLPMRAPGSAIYDGQTTAEEIEEMLVREQLEGGIEVSDYGDHLVVRVESGLLFDVGEAAVTPAGKNMLGKLTPLLLEGGGPVRVEGHTCDLQLGPNADFKNNWWLSSARALNVLEELTALGFPPERVSAVGYGEYRPIAANDCEENRRQNRRVEFIVEKRNILAD
jgi:chemotaxis protein MotB